MKWKNIAIGLFVLMVAASCGTRETAQDEYRKAVDQKVEKYVDRWLPQLNRDGFTNICMRTEWRGNRLVLMVSGVPLDAEGEAILKAAVVATASSMIEVVPPLEYEWEPVHVDGSREAVVP